MIYYLLFVVCVLLFVFVVCRVLLCAVFVVCHVLFVVRRLPLVGCRVVLVCGCSSFSVFLLCVV